MGFFGFLKSNKAISSAHSPEIQHAMSNQQKIAEQLQRQQQALNNMPDLDSRTRDMMKRNNFYK